MRLGFVGVAAPALFLCGIILGCDSEIASAPVEGRMEVRAAWSVGEPAPYDGVLVPGVFKVCTASSGGTGTYTIASNGSPGRVIAEATIPSGQCLNVFQAKKNEKKSAVPFVTVTPQSSWQFNGVVVIDGNCSVDCEVLPTPSSAVLTGFEGAIAKFYFQGTAGGHGGTGTLNFAVD